MKKLFVIILLFSSAEMFAQCYPDRHNTSWNDAWYSCEESENPLPQRGSGHWIMYDLRHKYRLGQGKLWNVNAPDRLAEGFNIFAVDYSLDGENWETLGQFNASQGEGDPFYEGEELFNFAGDTARYVLLTALSNYGGECFGIAEMRIDVIDLAENLNQTQNECLSLEVFPNPHEGNFTLNVNSFCNGPIEYGIYNSSGLLLSNGALPANGIQNFQMNTSGLAAGIYYLQVVQNGQSKHKQIIKLNN